MPYTFDEFKDLLMVHSSSFVVSKCMIEYIPHIFSGVDEYIHWKEKLSDKIGIDSKSITIVGSACVGFSLNPYKNYRLFDAGPDKSDIDVAVISPYHFDLSWRSMRQIGSRMYKLDYKQQRAVKEHANGLVYWGAIATDKVLELMPFGADWTIALDDMSKENATFARDIKIRIYRDYESLRNYHKNSFDKIKHELLSKS